MSYTLASSTSKPRSIATTPNSMASSLSSVNRTGTRRHWFPVACNKCHRRMDSTVFICSCKCLFCEECTYSHFQSSPNCPGCERLLGEKDFTEIMISDSGSKFATNPDEIVQSLLIKTSIKSSAPITWNDMCAAMIREHDAILTNTKVFVKQFVRETQRSLQEGRNAKTQVQAYQKHLVALKKDIIALKAHREEHIKIMHEKDRQIQQLKNTLARSSGKKSRNGEGEWQSGTGFVSSMIGVSKSSTLAFNLRHQKSAGFQNYVRRKEKGEIAQEQDLMNLTRKNNPMMYR